MPHRGPKPVDIELLRILATQWACLLYGLRDGYPGQLHRVEWGPCEMVRIGKQDIPVRKPKRTAGATIIYPGSKEQVQTERMLERIRGTLEREGYLYFRPVPPKREVWRQLKQAERPAQIEDFFRKIRRWAIRLYASSRRVSIPSTRAMFLGDTRHPNLGPAARIKEIIRTGSPVAWYLLPLAISSPWAEDILKAKRLWNYPKANRPRSDDKRIEFFAKSFGALTLGKAPATATARWLSGWHWPKDWFETVKGTDLMEGKP